MRLIAALLAAASASQIACPSVMPSGRFVQVGGSRVRLYLEPRWEDAPRQPGETYRFERGAGTLQPRTLSVVALDAKEWRTLSEALDARERGLGKTAVREREAPIRVSGVPGLKRAITMVRGDERWVTLLYGFVMDDRIVLIHGFAKPHHSKDSEADFDAVVDAIQILAR